MIRLLLSRREALCIGGLGAFGLSLADLLRLQAKGGEKTSKRAVIMVHLDGGPPQHDTIDPKPLAPVEIRGEFNAISTSLLGVQICETMPQVAAHADKFVFIRSLVGSVGQHNAFQCQSGYGEKELQSLGGRPAMGCAVTKLLGDTASVAPPFVDMMQGRPLVRNSARPGFLGPAFGPFRPDLSAMFQRELEPAMVNELAKRGGDHGIKLKLDESISVTRLDDRRQLLSSLDRIRRDVDGAGMMEAMDHFHRQAAGILTSGELAAALDLNSEDTRTIQRYTPAGSFDKANSYTSEGPESVQKFLLARRLIEAGVKVVSVSISDFDTHSKNFPRMRELLPIVDHGLRVLVDDLTERGLIDDVLIVAWGEFGRTPRIDPATGGRHHWPQVGPALLAGGGIRTGQVIGGTDRDAAEVSDRPVTYKDIFATLYRHLGIDARQTTLIDPQGRPQYLLDEGEPLAELG